MSVTGRTLLPLYAALLMAACGGGGTAPTSPGSPESPGSTSGPALDPSCPPSTTPSTCGPATTLSVLIQIGGTSAQWSYTVGSLTVSGSGQQYTRIVGITPGTVELSGQFQTAPISVRVGIPSTNAGGSIPPGSVQYVEGPGATVESCGIQYSNPAATPGTFKLRFTLNAAGSATSCRS
jgi:hypothetical protein